MKKERLFYLDVIRALSILLIVAYHFCVRLDLFHIASISFLLDNDSYSLGMVEVRLFFIISGVALMYTYMDTIDIKTFYKKRFLNIYPMYWLAYIGAFIAYYLLLKAPIPHAAPFSFVFTILGIDNYVMDFFPTFYLLGEWFLGVIIVFYIVFPLLRKLVNRYPIQLFVVMLMIVLVLAVYNPFVLKPAHRSILVSLFSCVLGMLFIKYVKSFHISIVVVSAVVALGIFIMKPEINVLLMSHVLAITLFVLLVSFSKYLHAIKWIKKGIGKISKFSYPIFLTHHVILVACLTPFKNMNFSPMVLLGMFLVTLIAILVVSVVLYYIEKELLKIIQNKKEVVAK